jgi:hypothetical protein
VACEEDRAEGAAAPHRARGGHARLLPVLLARVRLAPRPDAGRRADLCRSRARNTAGPPRPRAPSAICRACAGNPHQRAELGPCRFHRCAALQPAARDEEQRPAACEPGTRQHGGRFAGRRDERLQPRARPT